MKGRKERKSKGSLSVLDEFTSEVGVGEIMFSPKANPEVLKRIEKATKLADVPISSRGESISPVSLFENNISKEIEVEPNHKPKLSQSEAKPEPQPEPNHKPKLSQSEAKPEPKIINKGKVEPQPEPNHKPKLSQSEAKPEPNGDFESLVGLQKKTLNFIFESCLNSGSKISGAITISNVAFNIESTVAAVRKAIQRLEQKGYLLRNQFKDGRGGWTKYELPQVVYSDLLSAKTRAKLEPKLSQTRAKVRTQPEPQPEPNAPYSSSNNLNINTNTTAAEELSIPENLRKFGISTLNLKKLIDSEKTTLEVVEKSLAALSYDVSNGKTGNLANILFGVLATGREYISQKYSEALEKELEEELERLKSLEESEKKLQETRLELKFREYLEKNPNFLQSIQLRHRGFVNNPAVLEKLAFEEFRNLPETEERLGSS